MIFTRPEKLFIKQHRDILNQIFLRRINELKNNIFLNKDLSEDGRKLEIRFVQELIEWLQWFKVLSKEDETKNSESFV